MIQIDERSLIAQAPVEERLDRLEAALLARGATFGPLPDIAASASLADAVRLRAGRCAPRYGDVWDRVAALEAVFPGGRVVVTKGSPRAATGPDVTRTILEARGRLGEIRKVWLRLLPAPKRRERLRLETQSFGRALVALGSVLHSGARPAEVALTGTSERATLTLRFEGDGLLVDADVALSKRRVAALAGVALVDDSADATAPAGEGAAPANACLVEAPWSELPGALSAAVAPWGDEGTRAPMRLLAVMHEGALVEVACPQGWRSGEVTPSPAARFVERIQEALARRCA